MNLAEYRQALKDELGIVSTDPTFTDTRLNGYINRAIRELGTLYFWQETQYDWKMLITPVGDETDEYWEYPTDAVSDSVWRVAHTTDLSKNEGEVEYRLLTYADYLRGKREGFSTMYTNYAADHRRLLFLYPTPTQSLWILVWGHRVPPKLTNDTDYDVFHGQSLMESAIIDYALHFAFRSMRDATSLTYAEVLKKSATDKASLHYQRQRENQQYRQSDSQVMWEDIDIV